MTTYLEKGKRKKEEEENEEEEQKKKEGKEGKARRSMLLFCSKLDWKTERPSETFLAPHFMQPAWLSPLLHFYVLFF